MPITIEASVSKKVPIPGEEFSSRSASLTIRAEVTTLADIAGQAARLYQEAEAAIDAQRMTITTRSGLRCTFTAGLPADLAAALLTTALAWQRSRRC